MKRGDHIRRNEKERVPESEREPNAKLAHENELIGRKYNNNAILGNITTR